MTASAVALDTVVIESLPRYYRGWPHIARTGDLIAVLAVYRKAHDYTPEQIQDAFPHLTLVEVYAGLAYYYLNSEQIDADLREQAEEFERACLEHPGRVFWVAPDEGC